MHDYTKAFAVKHGLRINEDEDGPLITGGSSTPIGEDMPIGAIYFQPKGSGFDLWQKFGSGVNDWEVKEFVANSLITEFFASNDISTTTSSTFQDKINQNTQDLVSGKYAIFWSLEYTNTSNNKVSEIQVIFDAATIAQDSYAVGSNGGIYTIRSAIFLTDIISGIKNLKVQYRQNGGGGTTAIRRATIGYIKVG